MTLDAPINPTVANESVAPQSRVFRALVSTAFADPDPRATLILSPVDRRMHDSDQAALPVQSKKVSIEKTVLKQIWPIGRNIGNFKKFDVITLGV